MSDNYSQFLTVTEAAASAACPADTLHAAIAAGTLVAVWVAECNGHMIHPDALRQWHEARFGPNANGGTGALAVKGSIRRAARRTDPDDASLSPALLAGILGVDWADDGLR